MKAAVIFYSLSGNTAYVAERIKERLNADLIPLRPKQEYPKRGLIKFYQGGKSAVRAEEPELIPCSADLQSYDVLILGTPVWAGTFTPPMRTFLKQNRNILKEKKVAVYVCCSGGGGFKTIDKIRQFMEIASFIQEAVLIDPLEKETDTSEKAIQNFCDMIQKQFPEDTPVRI